MKFGHHGANHPVKASMTGTVMITSQNHGFAVDENTLPEKCLRATHVSLFDGSLQGMAAPIGRPSASRVTPKRARAPTMCRSVRPVRPNFIKQIALRG
jgi:carbamoylphosphate synthase small subunit